VFDTNALMHDPTSLFRFKEHDVFLPTIMLEELNTHRASWPWPNKLEGQ